MVTNPTTLARQLQGWALDPANARYFCTGQLQQIETALADPRRTTQLSIATWLLGTWRLCGGQHRVLEGDSGGWDEARIGSGLLRASLQIRAQRRMRRTRSGDVPDLLPLHAAHGAALALALQDPDAEELLEAIRALPDAFFGPDDAYPWFVRALLSLRAGGRPQVSPRLGPYADVLRHWHGDASLFARKLAGMLDHHLEQTVAHGTFAEPPVRLFPAELFAVRAVRRDLDLPMPKVEHALLYTNLATMQPDGPWPRDPLLARLQQTIASR